MTNSKKTPKRFIVIPIIITLLFLFIAWDSRWNTDVRMTNYEDTCKTSFNQAWCVGANIDTVHVVFYTFVDGNGEVYYMRSCNSGTTWTDTVNLSNDDSLQWYPSIAVSGSNVHVVWEGRDSVWNIYYKRSTDSGSNWGSTSNISGTDSISQKPSLAVVDDALHLVWHERMDDYEIYYNQSTNNGTSWGSNVNLSSNDSTSEAPSVAASGSNVYVTYFDKPDAHEEIYFTRSANNGGRWSQPSIISADDGFDSQWPCVAASADYVYLVWEDSRYNNDTLNIYWCSSSNNGTSWSSDTTIDHKAFIQRSPNITTMGSYVHVVYQDVRNAQYEIYHKYSSNWGGNMLTTSAQRVSNGSDVSERPSVAVGRPQGMFSNLKHLHCVWTDRRDNKQSNRKERDNWEIYYDRDEYSGGKGSALLSNKADPLDKHKFKILNQNPAIGNIEVQYSVTENSYINISVFDLLGRKVSSLFGGVQHPGDYSIHWDTRNSNGMILSAGLYFIVFETDKGMMSEKVILMRD